MSENDNENHESPVEPTSAGYVAPEIESVVTRESLKREVAYAGTISQQLPPP
jgi:hypothetical protein